jgi:CheY-like chemotaxis protein
MWRGTKEDFMTSPMKVVQPQFAVVSCAETSKLRVVLADESPEYMEVVLTLLDMHERIDLIGRAANFPETVQLALNHQPDLLLLDLDMHLANLVVPAVLLSSRNSVNIIGLCIDETISFRHMDCITGVNVLVHRKQFTTGTVSRYRRAVQEQAEVSSLARSQG